MGAIQRLVLAKMLTNKQFESRGRLGRVESAIGSRGWALSTRAPSTPFPNSLRVCKSNMQYNKYNTIQYNTTQHNTTQHNTTQHNTTQYNTIQYNTIQYNTTQHKTIQYNTIQCNAMQCNTIQYNTIQYNTKPLFRWAAN